MRNNIKDKIKNWLKNDHYQVFNSLMSVIFAGIIVGTIMYLWPECIK